MDKINLKDIPLSGMGAVISEMGEPPFRLKQLCDWLYSKSVVSIEGMTNFSKKMREKLAEKYTAEGLEIIERKESEDGTSKYLFRLKDSLSIEAVYIPDGERGTACISTQVGCKFGCAFCATGSQGFSRDLSLGEIVNQFVMLKNEESIARGRPLTNIVFMGMGEPLDNFRNLIDSIEIFNSPDGFGIGIRRITVSTVGIIPMLEKLGEEGRGVNLAVSLHSADEGIRTELMPVNRKYPVGALMKSLALYPLRPYRQITFEVIMLKGINDSREEAGKLARAIGKLKAKVNLIVFNPGESARFFPSPDEKVVEFQKELVKHGIAALIRKNRGGDIEAACGQLKSKYI
ncbi:MAG: 23S rRNA (adenine(2503)-C(2))-methyltransferase RlmN [Nitrospinota bacterium]|nr:23S rRNA (adenine(2503)-C(2))-methyltransferase RlmN [Nitrospinota bacterium]